MPAGECSHHRIPLLWLKFKLNWSLQAILANDMRGTSWSVTAAKFPNHPYFHILIGGWLISLVSVCTWPTDCVFSVVMAGLLCTDWRDVCMYMYKIYNWCENRWTVLINSVILFFFGSKCWVWGVLFRKKNLWDCEQQLPFDYLVKKKEAFSTKSKRIEQK